MFYNVSQKDTMEERTMDYIEKMVIILKQLRTEKSRKIVLSTAEAARKEEIRMFELEKIKRPNAEIESDH